ncbi:hypothetical protein D3C87_1139690 [compost metagenome]
MIGLGGRAQVDGNPDLALLGKLDGVADKIRQHLLEAQRVQQYIDWRIGRVEIQMQFKLFLPGQTIEDPYYGPHDLSRIDTLRAQAEVPGFDACNVENVADQFQQILRRVIGHIDGRTVRVVVFNSFQRQFEHADDRIHRRADFMAHGRQKRTFGPVGFICALFGTAQVVEQLPPFADVDPATDNALHLTA